MSRQDATPLPILSEKIAPAGRPLLVVSLMVGFYVLAILMAALLLLSPYMEWVTIHAIHFQIVIAGVSGGLIILFSIIPRPDRFKAPGPLLKRADQPQLFALLDEIGAATGQHLPAKVYHLANLRRLGDAARRPAWHR